MELDEVVELVRRVAADDAPADRATTEAAVHALRRLRGWCDGRELVLARRLAMVAPLPEQAVADASRASVRDAARVLERVGTAEQVAPFAEALTDGRVSAAHVDVMGRAMRQLEPAQRAGLVDAGERLVGVAATSSPEEFARTVSAEVRRLERDGGLTRLERQRRATRLRTWIDRNDGMWCLSGRFDPATGLVLDGRLRSMVATLFAESTPQECPADPGEKQDHLRALALVALTAPDRGRGGGPSVPEITVVVDTTTTEADGAPRVDWGLPVELPAEVLADLFGVADVHVVIRRNGAVLHAPGRLDLGRSTRVANRAQRRVLRGWYPTCAIPGCAVRFHHCKIHHVVWWRRGGRTDLANLLPVCERHHHAIHDTGWQLTLTPDRDLTITFHDGTVMTTGPPRRRAA